LFKLRGTDDEKERQNMSGKDMRLRFCLLLLVAAMVGVVPMYAGSAVIGSVAGSKNATVGGQALLPNTTLFSGDSLQVKDGVAVVAMGQGSRMVFGRETEASFLRDSNEVTVLLGQGNVSMYHPTQGSALRVKVGQISVVPAQGFVTEGEVAMLNGTMTVTAKQGALRVEGNGPATEVAQGKTIKINVKPAAAPQAGGVAGAAGTPVSTFTPGLITGIAGAGAAGVGAGFAIKANSNASNALTAANNATTAATNAANTAAAACKAISPTAPCP
jgi:hypothetical protein